MTSEKIVWLSGFVDGEGTIMLYTVLNKVAHCEQIQTAFKVGNTHKGNIDQCKEIVSEIVGREVRYTSRSVNGYRPLYMLAVHKQSEIERVLLAMQPYLIGKRPQCDLMLEYLNIRKSGHPHTPYEHEVVAKMKHMNRRFSPAEWADSQRETERLAPTKGEETVRTAA